MKHLVVYKICGQEHKVKVTALSQDEARNKVMDSLYIIKCELVEDEILNNIKSILGFE